MTNNTRRSSEIAGAVAAAVATAAVPDWFYDRPPPQNQLLSLNERFMASRLEEGRKETQNHHIHDFLFAKDGRTTTWAGQGAPFFRSGRGLVI